jgi:hypothetical protein
VKGISVRQPYAALILGSAKTLETRDWHTDYRGPVLLHASRSQSQAEIDIAYDDRIRPLLRRLGHRSLATMPRALILGTVWVTDCRPASDFLDAEGHFLSAQGLGEANVYGCWWEMPWVLTLARPRSWPTPQPWKGQQGLWEVSDPTALKLASKAGVPDFKVTFDAPAETPLAAVAPAAR